MPPRRPPAASAPLDTSSSFDEALQSAIHGAAAAQQGDAASAAVSIGPSPSPSPPAAATVSSEPMLVHKSASMSAGGGGGGSGGTGRRISDYSSAAQHRMARTVAWLKGRIFILTFISYAIYSGTRQPFGITKAALNPDHDKDPDQPGYAPFNSDEWGSTYLGACDTTFLSAYAVGLFITGPMGDRVNLRWFLGIGMIGSGVFCFLFGAGELMGIHNLAWFLACNLFAGLFQATGWPAVVTLMTRWFGKGNRGVIMGFWNAHGSVGNIIGKLFSTAMMHRFGWQWGFMSMGILCAAVGLMELLFVVPHPHDVLSPPEMAELERANAKGHIAKVAEVHEQATAAKLAGSSGSITPGGSISQRRGVELDVTPAQASDLKLSPAISHSGGAFQAQGLAHAHGQHVGEGSLTDASAVASPRHHDEYPSISFSQALRVPGVLEYSACLFFSKLVAYAFIFWLPYYLASPKLNYSDNEAGNVSTVYDVGGVAGGIIAGWLSDVSGKRGVVSGAMLLLCLPGLYIYSILAQYGLALNIILMFVVGILVNGPYTLISSAVAADLGNHPSLKGNPKAMSTVTGIIDGSGSVGAALQGVIIGLLGKRMGWANVFFLLMGFCFLSALTLQRIVLKEIGPPSSWRPIGQWCSKQREGEDKDEDEDAAGQHWGTGHFSNVGSEAGSRPGELADEEDREELAAREHESEDTLGHDALTRFDLSTMGGGGGGGDGGGGGGSGGGSNRGTGGSGSTGHHTRNSSASSVWHAVEDGEDGDVHFKRQSSRSAYQSKNSTLDRTMMAHAQNVHMQQAGGINGTYERIGNLSPEQQQAADLRVGLLPDSSIQQGQQKAFSTV